MPLAVSERTSTEVSVLGNVGSPCALLPAARLWLGTEGPQDLGGRQIEESLQVTRPTQQPLTMCQDGPHPAGAGGARIIPHSTSEILQPQDLNASSVGPELNSWL